MKDPFDNRVDAYQRLNDEAQRQGKTCALLESKPRDIKLNILGHFEGVPRIQQLSWMLWTTPKGRSAVG